MRKGSSTQAWLWLIALLAAIAMPWVFYNYHTGRQSGFVVSMLSQMGMMSILALSYNMLLGQSGLFSFCHAVFFGIGGYATIHFLNLAGDGTLPIPLELVPVLAGLSGAALAIVFGYMATKQRATAFAMITLGIGELMTTAALMFHHFFGGEGGVNTNRMIGHSLFGFKYGPSIQVYYLILGWTVISALLMLYLTRTPLGRMANASRDNFERVQFVGYDPRLVRFTQFVLSGFFAGIGGGLYAITYEIVTFDALAAPLSANALLMAYIGGSASFGGPILGAVLITLLQSGVSLMSNSWLVYVGVLFITMVMFAPQGIMGLIAAHGPIVRGGRFGKLLLPYVRVIVPCLVMVLGFVGVVELASFLTIGAAQGKALVLFGNKINEHDVLPWLAALICLVVGTTWFAREARAFRRVWDGLMSELKPQRSAA
ncbi:MAG: branched-chain amino acid ABC transporter permease [Bradyrhizobium sp.]|nr:branched-chain amino acid ABC transporter permease [Bradyrhizobium sp.]